MADKKQKGKWIPLMEALQAVNEMGFGTWTSEALRGWCRKYDIGKKIGGKWFIDKAKMKVFIESGSNKYQSMSAKEKRGGSNAKEEGGGEPTQPNA